jgi:hypothetical protein
MDSKKERIILLGMACGILVVGFGYLFMVTFIPIPQSGADHAKVVTGFMLGSAIGSIITYFWGSSKGSADKSKLIDDLAPRSLANEKK